MEVGIDEKDICGYNMKYINMDDFRVLLKGFFKSLAMLKLIHKERGKRLCQTSIYLSTAFQV